MYVCMYLFSSKFICNILWLFVICHVTIRFPIGHFLFASQAVFRLAAIILYTLQTDDRMTDRQTDEQNSVAKARPLAWSPDDGLTPHSFCRRYTTQFLTSTTLLQRLTRCRLGGKWSALVFIFSPSTSDPNHTRTSRQFSQSFTVGRNLEVFHRWRRHHARPSRLFKSPVVLHCVVADTTFCARVPGRVLNPLTPTVVISVQL